jgi:carboxylesterase type B
VELTGCRRTLALLVATRARSRTVWGESAGARGVSYHLIAYRRRDDGLFRAAVMQSGSPVKYTPTAYTNASAWDVYYNNITAAANCSSAADTLDCLRQVPIDALSSIVNCSVASSASWGPAVEGDFIQDTGPALLSEGKFVHVPILLSAKPASIRMKSSASTWHARATAIAKRTFCWSSTKTSLKSASRAPSTAARQRHQVREHVQSRGCLCGRGQHGRSAPLHGASLSKPQC